MVRLVPTKRLWAFVAFGLVFAIGGAFVPGLESLMLPYDLALAVLYFVTGKVAARWPAVRVVRTVDPALSVRMPNTVELTLESEAPVELDVRIRDEVPETCSAVGNEFVVRLSPRRPMTREYVLTPQTRGAAQFRGIFMRFDAPLGLAQVEHKTPAEQEARVYPNVKAVADFELLKQRGRLQSMGLRRSKIRGLGTEFESLREYNEDDLRFVDWKSSARRGRLVVKNFEQERNQSVIVCADLGRHMLGEINGATKLDHALDAALLLYHAAERSGDMVGLFAFDDAVRAYVAPRRGKAQTAAVLRAAHALQPVAIQPDYVKAFTYLSSRWKRRSLVVVFTDAESEDQARDLAEGLRQIKRHHLLFVVRVRDPRLAEVLNMVVDSERALFSRAAATWYQEDRALAEAVLSGAGIQSIEAEPQHLASALVSAYYAAKDSARL